jgi:hypothetical protein
MRMLTSYELELIAGGTGSTDDDTHTYWPGGGTGGSGGFGGFWYLADPASYFGDLPPGGNGTWIWVSTNGQLTPVPGSGNSGGTGSNPPPAIGSPPPETPCERDAAEDAIATSAANLIKSMPDWHEREYGALIVRYPDGNYGLQELTRGETVAEALYRFNNLHIGPAAPQTKFSFSDIGQGVIVGAIHNHPDKGYTDAEDIENQYPSYYDNAGDYGNFEALIGPDGVLREFNLADGHLNPSNDPNPASRSNLAADRPCG